MNKKLLLRMAILVIFILIFLSISLLSNLIFANTKIIIDGNDSDWEGIITLANTANKNFETLKVTNDKDYLYFYINGKYINKNYGLLLNTDNNVKTGHIDNSFTNTGFDYLIENGNLYKSYSSSWSWYKITNSSLESYQNTNFIEISIKKSDLNITDNQIYLLVKNYKPSWNLASCIPINDSILYTFGKSNNSALTSINTIKTITNSSTTNTTSTIKPIKIQTSKIPSANKSQGSNMNILVPAYFYSSSIWQRLTNTANEYPGRIYAIGNPDNGPGGTIESHYTRIFSEFSNSNGKYFGYVSTQYSDRPIDEVKLDIDNWYNFYNPDGIFLDEQSNENINISYYKELYNYIKTINQKSLIVGNPGSSTTESYLTNNNEKVTDIICIYEKDKNFSSWQTNNWCFRYSSENFYALPYNTSSSDYKEYVDIAKRNNIGWIYCTDDNLENPWDSLPGYFENFCEYVMY